MIGSAGRLLDMMTRKMVYAKDLEMLVVDDASRFFDSSSSSKPEDALLDAMCKEFMSSVRPQLVLSTTCNAGGGPAWMDRRRHLWRRTAGEGLLTDETAALLHEPGVHQKKKKKKMEFFALPEPWKQKRLRKDHRALMKVTIPQDQLLLESVMHFYVELQDEEQKFATLLDLHDRMVSAVKMCKTMIFVNTKRKADWLAESARSEGYSLGCLHGDLDMPTRKTVLTYVMAILWWCTVIEPLARLQGV